MSNGPISAHEQTLARVREQRRILEAVTRIGGSGLTRERLMQHVAAQVSRATKIERTKILRYRPERGDLLIEAGVGWNPGVVGQVAFPADYQSPAGRAFQTAAPVRIRNITEAKEFRFPDVLRDHNIVSVLNVPVLINGLTWGVLEVDSTRPTDFDEWDVSFLAAAANLTGMCIALANANEKNWEAAADAARERARFETVFRELQHRVKNNLTIIIGFLTHAMQGLSTDVQAVLKVVIGRIQGIALAHDLLSVTNKTGSVDFDDYLRALRVNIVQPANVAIEVDAQKVSVPIERAVPAGLIVNELVTNSLKYAFGNSGGHVKIEMAVGNGSEVCVTVADDGRGMELPPTPGLGLKLVERLAQQIQGRVQYEKADTGTRTILCFPVAL